ncbi:DUF3344 domain-containing protein [Methanofollis tationis]|uniref:DUF3344 domain-containing protein n=1 Tax=Methanofollis tationis TaxID=81417 RepID=A0A7K4HKD4_9EURY|nr:DUF3344 domain-containing protein [Methanofollis tationis]
MNAGRYIPLVLGLLLCLALIPATVSADGIDLVTVGSGTVSGGLWSDPGIMWNTSWPSTGGVEVTKAYALPAYTDLDWARLYVAVYLGSTAEAKQTTVEIAIDGDGDGTFDPLALESLNSTDIGVIPGKAHITRESSNYVLWYDVKDLISAQNPSVLVNTTGSFDGRVKAACLVAAYNDGDADRVYYRVNGGHFNGPGSTDFDLSDLPAAFEDADLTNLYLASTEATEYTFNGDTIAAYDSDKVTYSGYNRFDVNASVVSGYNTFAWPGAGSYYRSVLALLSVKAQPANLEITAITPNANEIFANEPNTIAATVKNNGTSASGAFQVLFSINGAVQNVSVSDLAAGNTTTVSVVDPAIRALGDAVTIVVTTDASPANNLTLTKSVVYNGYKGKRYTGGDDIVELTNFTVTGGLAYSTGDSAYMSGSAGWTDYTANWTPADLALPANATVGTAYLCAFYTYDQSMVMPDNITLAFNGVGVPYLAHYTDRKLYGTYNYPSGMVVYNVTDAFDPAGNGAVFTNLGTGKSSFNGMTLFVVYEDPAATQKQIIFNAGYDILSGRASYAVSPEEATAYAPFAGIASADSARLITVAPAASAEGILLFGNQTWTPAWNYAGSSNLGIDDRDVTAYLNTTPVAAFRSDNDYFDAACAVLVLDLGTPAAQDLEITAITPNANEIFANEPNTIAATVKNNGTAASGAFQVLFSINGAVQNVSVSDLAAGNTTTVSVVDPAIRALGDAVTIVVTTDASPANNLTLTKSVVYNGYKGKRYTGGDDIVELTNFTVTGGLAYSTGDSAYMSGSAGWTDYTANWTPADLALPANATVGTAYLCAFYTYDQSMVMPDNITLAFNGVGVPYLAHYTDRKLYGTYNYPSGMVVYNVTDAFDPAGNGAVFTNLGTGKSSFNGMTLFVVYEDPAATQKQIIFNAGYDILSGRASYAVSPEEATAYAPFAGIASADSARLITVAPAASAEGILLFGNQTWTPAWNYAGSSNLGIDDRDVTAYLNTTPVAAFRSDNDYFDAACAVLVLDLGTPAAQDLEITAITPNANEIFANEPNTIAATVKNNGTAASGAFQVLFSINGAVQNVSVSDLAAGNTTTVSVVDPAIRALGDAVTIVVTTDASPANNLTLTKSVVYNGYKGKRYTGGDDIVELTNFTVTGGLAYSTGDSAYMSGSAGWTDYTANWTPADLALPANATVGTAYLCAFYTYDQSMVMPDNITLAFNGVGVPYLAHYTDRKLYGTYNYPSGMVVYNVTDAFDPAGNGAVFTNLGTGKSSFNGMTLFVVYEDPAATQKQIIFNAGYDILSGRASYAVSPEEATAYAPFTYQPLLGVNLSAARLITVAPAANAEGTLLFGNQAWTTAWSYAGASNLGIDERDVTADLNATPVAAFRSDNDYFDAACAILVLEYGGPIVPPTPAPDTGGDDDAGTIAAAGDLSAGETISFSYSGTVSRVMVTVSRPTSGIMLAVTEQGTIPVDGPSGAVYRYLEADLSYTTDDGIEEAIFEFSVPLSWLAERGLTVRDIVLMRYHNGAWTALPTELIGESGNEARYRATSSGFSYFAVVTEKNGASVAGESAGETPAVTATPTQTPVATTPAIPTTTAAPAATGTTAAQATTPQASPLLEILPFAALGIFLLMRRK